VGGGLVNLSSAALFDEGLKDLPIYFELQII
jgi:hypothetical protein